MARVQIDVRIEGLKELKAKLKADDTLGPPWKAALEEVGKVGLSAAQAAAPVGETGQLKAKLVSKMQSKPIPMWVSIKTTARASDKKRYPYPKRIEYDAAMGHRLWMTSAIKGAMGAVQGILDKAARAIEGKWNS